MANIIATLQKEQLKTDLPVINIGDYVDVHTKIKEGSKERIQIFSGTVTARKGTSLSETLTVRNIYSDVGVIRIFQLHSNLISKIDVVKRGKVRRAKLYYLYGKVGKAAKVKVRLATKAQASAAKASSSQASAAKASSEE